ncbi:MAG: hypothetical protein E6Q97_29300 [Desulfurellales bacterium]|nr:MAG: hypothetical protein E6Q97_29300 [Desulfurellales bacterium]
MQATFGNYQGAVAPQGYPGVPSWGGVTNAQDNAGRFATQLASRPYQQYTGDRIAQFSPETQQSWGMIANQAKNGDPSLNAARSQLTNTISGQYLDPSSNPYLRQTYDQAANRMADAYSRGTASQTMSQFARGGAFGGSAMQETQAANNRAFGDSLADLGSQIYGGNYQQERGRQLQAMTMAPQFANQRYVDAAALAGIGQQKQAYDQSVLDMNKQDWDNANQYGMQQLQMLMPAAGWTSDAQHMQMQRDQYQDQQNQINKQNRNARIGGILSGAYNGYQSSGGNWGDALMGGILGAF